MTGELAGRPVLTVPSTYVQARPNFDSGEIEWTHEPSGFALHTLLNGELISHVQPVREVALTARDLAAHRS